MVSGQFAADEREWTRMGIELRQHMKAVPRITAHLREFSRMLFADVARSEQRAVTESSG